MEIGKIQIKIGAFEFFGEGNQEWLTMQMDKVLDKLPSLIKVAPIENDKENSTPTDSKPKDDSSKNITNLSAFLKDKNATTNQVKKFLATAAFLQFKGKNRLTTSDIGEALKNSNQTRLGNASDCLLQNIKKGHCEKDGAKEFFVTSHGFEELGLKYESL